MKVSLSIFQKKKREREIYLFIQKKKLKRKAKLVVFSKIYHLK